MRRNIVLSLTAVTVVVAQYRCPKIDCEDKDRVLQEKGGCFYASMTSNPPGRIDTIYVGSCPNDDPQTKKNCNLKPGKYVWPDTELQFMVNPKGTNESLFYNKLDNAKCLNVSDTIKTSLYPGRKCLDTLQCKSRSCDSGTNLCVGRSLGDTCSDHEQCDADLSCRVQSIWPYATTCQPRGEVRSNCETDYDCKTRNFCWQLSASEEKICLEKHNAPYGTQFFWNSNDYPNVNKKSVLFHGQYCQSGYAMRRSANVAECVDIQNITNQTVNSQGQNVVNYLSAPYQCTADGFNQCYYRTKTGEVAFSLTCECALTKNGTNFGFCPLPDKKLMTEYISAMKEVWYQDNCHTYDRENLNAQIDCGCGDYDSTLPTAVNLRFKVYYYPYSQDSSILDCIKRVIPDSGRNIFV